MKNRSRGDGMADNQGAAEQHDYPWSGEMDAVTGIPPRKALDLNLPFLLRALGSLDLPLSAVMIDIDHFKSFNDKWGHETGDRVLRHVSSLIRRSVKFRGEAYRYGGEEITVLLPNADLSEAVETAERIRKLIYDSPLKKESKDGKGEIPLSVSVSLGVSSFPMVDGSSLLVAADQALYEAKKNGRNRVCQFTEGIKQDGDKVQLEVRFPAPSSIREGKYIILAKWFRHYDDITEIEAREISDPGTNTRELATGPRPRGGYVTAEIRGRVTSVERRGDSTFFTFEVEPEVLDLMYHHLSEVES